MLLSYHFYFNSFRLGVFRYVEQIYYIINNKQIQIVLNNDCLMVRMKSQSIDVITIISKNFFIKELL